jgi:hypothetical protein
VTSNWRLVLLVGSVIAMLCGACGGAALLSSGLPRTTDRDIIITVAESVETLPLPGCHTYWMTRNQEPPPGACEQTTTVRSFVARHDAETVETSVVGEPTVDPLYAMQLASRNLTEGVSVLVVIAPAETTVVRLIDSGGEVMDRVQPSGQLVALAGFGSDLTVEALSADGTVIAACPPDGVTLGGITYLCTLASGATVPITTTTLAGAQTP